LNSRTLALLIQGMMLLVASVLLVDRGGLIAWSIFIVTLGLLIKTWRKPGKTDVRLSLALAMFAGLAWAVTLNYVISTYESGEVVELTVDTVNGVHKARVWIFDGPVDEIAYYDAEPEVADALLSGQPLQFLRGGKVSTRLPKAALADNLSEDEAKRVFDAMSAKYGARMTAADLYYVLLGRPRDRVALIVGFNEG